MINLRLTYLINGANLEARLFLPCLILKRIHF